MRERKREGERGLERKKKRGEEYDLNINLFVHWRCLNKKRASFTCRRTSRLSGDISTAMLGIGHGELRERLVRLGPAAGVRVVPVTEEFTSRLCGGCGCSHCSLGASKVFVCPNKECRLKEERDGGGALSLLRGTFLSSDRHPFVRV